MTWTYNVANLATDETYQVRLLCGDTDTNNQLIQDEEIDFLLSENSGVYFAAAAACEAIAAKLADEADQKTGKIATWLTKRVDKFLEMAKRLREVASRTLGRPYAGGISISDKEDQEADTDRVVPAFKVGIMDNES